MGRRGASRRPCRGTARRGALVLGVPGRHGVRGAGGPRAPGSRSPAASMARGADGQIPPGGADRPVPPEPSRGGSLPQLEPLGRAVVFRLHDALGYSPIQLPRYWSYIRATNRLPVFYNAAVLQLPSLQDMRLLGVRYLIGAQGVGLPPGLSGSVVASERGYDLYRVVGSEPRVSVVSKWTTVPGGVEALEAIRDDSFDPGRSAVVEGQPGFSAAGQPGELAGSATYRETVPEDVSITASATAPSVVVVRNAWDGGWSATVDGRPAPVLRTDYFLQGVPIPSGTHEIRLTYRDPMIGRGLVLSALVWLGWLAGVAGLVIVGRRRSRTVHGPEERSGI